MNRLVLSGSADTFERSKAKSTRLFKLKCVAKLKIQPLNLKFVDHSQISGPVFCIRYLTQKGSRRKYERKPGKTQGPSSLLAKQATRPNPVMGPLGLDFPLDSLARLRSDAGTSF